MYAKHFFIHKVRWSKPSGLSEIDESWHCLLTRFQTFFFFNNLVSRLKRIPCCVYISAHKRYSFVKKYNCNILSLTKVCWNPPYFSFLFSAQKNNKHNFIIFLNKHNWGQCWCTCIVTISFIHKTHCIDGIHQF